MKQFKVLAKKNINIFLSKFELNIIRAKGNSFRNGINLNIGCGHYEINGFASLDVYSAHYYKNKGKFNRIQYDIRKDKIPYNNETVDTIYCSHVIEHIETNFVLNFLSESYRVLKYGGILRIACPDAKFLYSQLLSRPKYFSWHPLYTRPEDAVYCFVDEVSGHRLDLPNFGLDRNIFDYSYDELLENLREGGQFNIENPGIHINSWDFSRLREFGQSAGFSAITESRCKQSPNPVLQGWDMDLTAPEMSMYVELEKI